MDRRLLARILLLSFVHILLNSPSSAGRENVVEPAPFWDTVEPRLIALLRAGLTGWLRQSYPIMFRLLLRFTEDRRLECPDNQFLMNDPRQINAQVWWESPQSPRFRRAWRTSGPCSGCRFPEGQTRVQYTVRTPSIGRMNCNFFVWVFVVRCDDPRTPNNGYYWCSPSSNFVRGTDCRYGCFEGFELEDPNQDTQQCREIASTPIGVNLPGVWVPPRLTRWCRRLDCGPLKSIQNANHYVCTRGTLFPSRCQYFCNRGFGMKRGSSSVSICFIHGEWEQGNPVCQDIEVPTFDECPDDFIVRIGKGADVATAVWETPGVSDNYDDVIYPLEVSGRSSPAQFAEGLHAVKYIATDAAGNAATPCSFDIFVQRLYCPRMIPHHGVIMDCPRGFAFGDNCTFSCRHGWALEGDDHVICDMDEDISQFPIWNWNKGPPTCKSTECAPLTHPSNGQLSCDVWFAGDFCETFCNEGYDFSPDSGLLDRVITCQRDGIWTQEFLPNCMGVGPFVGVAMKTQYEYLSTSCCESDEYARLKVEFEQALTSSLDPDVCRQTECVAGVHDLTCIGDCDGTRKRKGLGFSVIVAASIGITYNQTSPQSFHDASVALTGLFEGSVKVLRNFSNDVFIDYSSSGNQAPSAVCPEGFGLAAGTPGCLQCQPGSFHHLLTQSCEQCPIGFYQASIGQLSCVKCPEDHSTTIFGSTSEADCKRVCPAGFYSSTGLFSCSPCPPGTYSVPNGSEECQHCPMATWTTKQAASSLEICQNFDIRLRIQNETGFVRATSTKSDTTYSNLLITGRYLTSINMTTLEMPSHFLKVTFFNYQAIDTSIKLSLRKSGLLLKFIDGCEQLLPAIASTEEWTSFALNLQNTNNSEIHVKVGQHEISQHLLCDTGNMSFYTNMQIDLGNELIAQDLKSNSYDVGVHSITDVNLVSSATIETEEVQQFFDECGFTFSEGILLSWQDIAASNIRENIAINTISKCNVFDDCSSNPCQNKGRCTDLRNDFTCSCTPGFTGRSCETNIDDCVGNMCLLGSSCIDGIDKYTCLCDENSRGEFCEQIIHHGGWSEWGFWQPCSVSCGGNGTSVRTRRCDNPFPDMDGKPCLGQAMEVETCGEESCPYCEPLEESQNSVLECDEFDDVLNCTHQCKEGYGFTRLTRDIYSCGENTSYLWDHQTLSNDSVQLPSCTKMHPAGGFELMVTLLYNNTPCTAEVVQMSNDVVQQSLKQIACLNDHMCSLTSQLLLTCDPVAIDEILDTLVQIEEEFPQDNVNLTDLEVKIRKQPYSLTSFTLTSRLQEDIVKDDALQGLSTAAFAIHEHAEAGHFDIRGIGINHPLITHLFGGPNLCPRGMTSSGLGCVPCAPGEFENTNACFQCPFGQYQKEEGQEECNLCPGGFTTLRVGSITIDHCMKSCEPGEWANGTMCRQCVIGSYNDERAQAACFVCPSGTTTSQPGATKCSHSCPNGTYGESGLCYECPVGS